jgi:hypothetical protein
MKYRRFLFTQNLSNSMCNLFCPRMCPQGYVRSPSGCFLCQCITTSPYSSTASPTSASTGTESYKFIPSHLLTFNCWFIIVPRDYPIYVCIERYSVHYHYHNYLFLLHNLRVLPTISMLRSLLYFHYDFKPLKINFSKGIKRI